MIRFISKDAGEFIEGKILASSDVRGDAAPADAVKNILCLSILLKEINGNTGAKLRAKVSTGANVHKGCVQ